MEWLSLENWKARQTAYRTRLAPALTFMRHGKKEGAKDAIYDFLFDYYFYRPARLARWSPGVDVVLEGATKSDIEWKEFQLCEQGLVLPAHQFPERRIEGLDWSIKYLETVLEREPTFGCFGLHEWAMVYQCDATRHAIPLRLTAEEVNTVVETSSLRCTHYDAFRFFTPRAVPLNRKPLTRLAMLENEQAGCVHNNMDLYKFAFTIAPYSTGELIADAFEAAVAARELDMRASPYDLAHRGFPAVKIETREGREEYTELQRAIHERCQPIRMRVLEEYRRLRNLIREDSRRKRQ